MEKSSTEWYGPSSSGHINAKMHIEIKKNSYFQEHAMITGRIYRIAT